MSKRIEIDGKFYRKRRGKLVEIPPEWVGVGSTKMDKRVRRGDREALKHKPLSTWGRGKERVPRERRPQDYWPLRGAGSAPRTTPMKRKRSAEAGMRRVMPPGKLVRALAKNKDDELHGCLQTTKTIIN